jgi:tetratricopeptide (TPR) repeat protein
VALKSGGRVFLADAVAAFESASPGGLPGRALFLEHVHFNFDGAYLLAKTLLEQVDKALPETIRQRQAKGTDLDKEACERQLAYTVWDRYRITRGLISTFIAKPPFTNQLNHGDEMKRLKRLAAELETSMTPDALTGAHRQYKAALATRDDDWHLWLKLGTLLSEAALDLEGAAKAFDKVRQLIPHSWLGDNATGALRLHEGDLPGAIAHLESALEKKPNAWEALHLLASAYRKSGDVENAMTRFERLLSLRPDSVPAYQNLAEMLSQKGEPDAALALLRRGLEAVPNSAVLHATVGNFFYRQKKWEKAIAAYEKALALDPDAAPIRKALEQAQKAAENR